MPCSIEPLKKLALLGAIDDCIKISSSEFTNHISTSSKTAARILKKLDDENLIKRKIVSNGQLITITEQGLKKLRDEYADYQRIFEKEDNIELYGYVVNGLGEGKYYISLGGYKKQFEDKLHFIPYPGTLNVCLTNYSKHTREKLEELHAIQIEGFTDGERTFGSGKCYKARIEDIESAIILPSRSHYPSDLLEIIAPVNLRKKLNLKDGDEVEIILEEQSQLSRRVIK
ncbi:MAG: winged helix-turn-helix domain-containing protein/riboflavin kinase [Methanohalobium sp.]|uniref:winged helix-turn-helix domain-containing protein/riboflavin kinase n=1 Tax=Methanohalobium sp. TaxID=2837493 RepID=UPI00397B1736